MAVRSGNSGHILDISGTHSLACGTYSSRNRRRSIAKCMIDDRCDLEHSFIFEWAAGQLHPDGQSLWRTADSYDRCRRSQQIEPLRIAHGIEILDLLTLDMPAS